MSIAANARAASAPGWLRPAVYSLSAAGLALGYLVNLTGQPIFVALLLAAPIITLGLAASAPSKFEIRRAGVRIFNVLVGGGVMGVVIAASPLNATGQTQAIAAALGALCALGVALVSARGGQLEAPIQYAIVMALLGLVYGAAAATVADVRFDRAESREFRTAVTHKIHQTPRSKTFDVLVLPWGPHPETNSVRVTGALYRAVQVGDPVCITLHPGALGMPWYTVAQCTLAVTYGAA